MLISGEPGIGKSRLTAALSEHIGTEPHSRLLYFCSPHHQDSALYPFIAQLDRAAGFVHDDTVEEKLEEGDDGMRLEAHHSAWSTYALAGDSAKTRDHTDAGRLLYDPTKLASHRLVYGGHDPGVCAGGVGAQANGRSDIPKGRSQASPVLWRWPSGSPSRTRCVLPSSCPRWFISFVASPSERYANSRPPRRWLRINGSDYSSNLACWAARRCSNKVLSTKQSPAFART